MKKRLLSLLLTLVMILGMIPATAPAAQATSADTIIGVIFDAGGYKDHGSSYYLADSTVDVKLASGQIVDYSFLISPLYTDEAGTNKMKSEPELDKTYYFSFWIVEPDVDHNITNANSSIHVDGFHGGRVLTSEIDGHGDLWIRCSITYGSLTGGVKAVASGVEYDSAEGGYAPNFTTLKAVSTEGKELEKTMVDGKYSYYGAKSGCLYKTNNGTSFSNMLTTEPQAGETYYSYFLLDSIDGNLNIEEELVDIQIPGYEVEYIASYERDMGFTSLVVYKATKVFSTYVGGVGMKDGDYLAVGATKTQTTKPSGGYAYYKDGKLTLNNYSYEGKGYQYASLGLYATVYANQDLTLELIGKNTLTQTDSDSDMIYVDGAKLTVGGDGKLTGTSRGYALYAYKDITINGGTIELSTYYTSIISSLGKVIINGGDITAESEDRAGIYSYYGVTVNGGNVTAIGGNNAIDYGSFGSFTVAEDMNIQVYVSDTNDFASATKWDGTTDISDYNCVWIVEELQSAELIKWVGTQLQATSNLDMQFALRVSDLKGTTGNYIVLTRTYVDGSTDAVTIPQSQWTESNGFYIVAYSGIAAKEMNDVISAVAYNAKGAVISETRSESIVTYALSMLGKITNPEQKTMFVDMLNYGAEAQKFFHYDEAHLANAGLTEEQKAWATQEDIEVVDHRVKGPNFFGSQLSLENVILLQMAFKVAPAEGMYAIASFTDHNGKKVEETLTVENNNGYSMVSVNSLAIADYRTLVTVTLYNADGSVAGSAVDSMASYVARSKTDLGKAIMKFGASAYAYFH